MHLILVFDLKFIKKYICAILSLISSVRWSSIDQLKFCYFNHVPDAEQAVPGNVEGGRWTKRRKL